VDEIAKLLPALPLVISVPLTIAVLIVTLWPKIIQSLTDLSAERRRYEIERRQLELLRLRYEIEALRKEKGLERLQGDSAALDSSRVEPRPTVAPAQFLPLKRFQKFAFGVAGAALPIAMNLSIYDFGDLTSGISLPALLTRLLLFALIAGCTAVLLPRSLASKTACFLLGVSVTLMLTILVQGQLEVSASHFSAGVKG
jgi:hypothetical protein